MWPPPIAWTPEEQKMAARTRKARKFCVCLRARRHELLAATFQAPLAATSSAEPGSKEPVEAGMLALATLLPASCHVGDREAVALTVLDKRWPRGLDCLGAEQPPVSQSPLCNFRMRLMAHTLDQTLLARPGAWAEQTGGCGARPRRAALASTPLCGAGRVEATWHLLGHALRKAVGLVAQPLGTATDVLLEAAGLTVGGHRSRKAALDLNGGEPRAKEQARRLGLAEVERWKRWLEPPPSLPAPQAPLRAVLATLVQIGEQDTEPAPEGGPGGRRLKKQVAPERRMAREDKARRHGRKRRAKTFNGFTEPCVLALDSRVPRAVGGRPAHEPAYAAVEVVAAARERGQGWRQLDLALGDMARPRIVQWAEPGVYSMARPWPCGGPCVTTHACRFTCAHGTVTCPGGQTVPMIPGRAAPCPASACDACLQRTQCTTAKRGPGRPLTIREDEPFQQKRRAKLQTKRGRASLRQRPAVEHAMSHHGAHPGRRARDQGLRQKQCDGRRHAALSNLPVAAYYEEQRQLAS